LINFIKCLWIDSFSKITVLFGPILKDQSKVGTYANGLFK